MQFFLVKQQPQKTYCIVNQIHFITTVAVITTTLLISNGCSKDPKPNKTETAVADSKAATEPKTKSTSILKPKSIQSTPRKPVKQRAGDPNRTLKAHLKMRQLVLGLHLYEGEHGMINPDTTVTQNYAPSGRPHLSWRVHILPELGETELYEQFKLDESWDSPHNKKLLAKMPDVFRDPSDPANSTTTRFRAVETVLEPIVSQPTTMLSISPWGRAIKLRDIVDGLSNTVLLVETAPEKATPWTKPDGLPLLPDNPAKAFGPINPSGILVALGDLTVKVVRPDTPPQVWANLLNFADGQEIEENIFLPLPSVQFVPRTDFPLHLAYLDPSFMESILVFNPKAMAETKQATAMLSKLYKDGVIPSLKLLKELDTVIVWIKNNSYGLSGYYLLQFSAPTTREKVLKNFEINPKELWQHDERTWLIAPEKLVKKLAFFVDDPPKLLEYYEGMDLNHQMTLRYFLSPIITFSASMESIIKSLHLKELSQIRGIEATLDLSGEALFEVNLRMTKPMIVTQLKEQIQEKLKTPMHLKTSPEVKALVKSLSQNLEITQTLDPKESPNSNNKLHLKLKNFTKYADVISLFITEIVRPAITASHLQKREEETKHHLKQIGLAFHNFHDTHGHFPPSKEMLVNGKSLLSWRVHLLPYLDQQKLYQQFHLNEPWDSTHNKKLLDRMPDIYKTEGVDQPGRTSIMTFSGKGTPFAGGPGPSMKEITDDMFDTILCVLAGPDKAVPWTQPLDLPLYLDNPIKALGQLEKKRFLALKMDGAIHWIPTYYSANRIRMLIQHNDQ